MLQKLICLVGVFCFFLGGCVVESDSPLVPLLLASVGGLTVLATVHAYEL